MEMLKAFIHIKVTEQHKYNSNMNYKIYPRKKQIFIVFMVKKILQAMESKETMTDDEIADLLARTLDDRRQLLKIMSMNHYGNVRKVPQRYGF